MNFGEAYFEGEEREGFYIEPMMKRAWAAQLEVLRLIDDICSRYKIEYFADYGTLLGAIRHGGYIPWDDDLDIGMKRLDYERFLKIAEKELPQDYKILTVASSDEWNKPFARVVNACKFPLDDAKLRQFHGFPFVAGIDIFPIDYLPVNKAEEDMYLELFGIAYKLAITWDETEPEERMENLRWLETGCNIKFTDDKPYTQQLWILADRLASMYWDIGAEAAYVTAMFKLVENPNFRVPASCYQSAIRVPFENTTIPIPADYEQVLTAYYGEDYMTPKHGVADHEYPFYNKQKKTLLSFYEERGLEIPDYLKC